MSLVGDAVFAVLPEFKDFDKNLVSGVTDAAKKAQAEIKPIEIEADTSQVEGAFSRLGDLARVVAGVAIVAGLKHAIDTGREWVSTVNAIRRATGDNLEDASRLAFVLDRVGIGAEDAAPFIAILNKNLQQGGANFKQYFDAATIAELRISTFSKQLPILAEAYQKLAVGQERTTFLFNTFGRAGQDVDKLLKLQTKDFAELADEAARFGLVLDETNAAAFKEFAANQRAAEQASKGLQLQIGQLTLPVFEAFDEVMIKVLTTLTNLPEPVQALIGVFAVGAIGIGKYGQAITAAVEVGKLAVAGIAKLIGLRGAEAAATVAATTAQTAEVAATTALAGAHNAAAVAAGRHATAETTVAAASGAAAAAQATGAAVTSAAAAAGPAAGAAGLALGSVLVGGVVAALAGAAIGAAIDKYIINPFLDARERTHALEEDILKGRALVTEVLTDAAGEGASPIHIIEANRALRELNAEGRLTPEITQQLFSAGSIKKIKDAALAGEDVGAVIRQMVKDLEDAEEAFGSAGVSVESFTAAVHANRIATAAHDAALFHMQQGLEGVSSESEAGTNIVANYAKVLFLAKKAAAEAAGAQFDVAGAIAEAAAEANKAADDFREAEKKRAAAIEEANERLAKAIEDAQERIADAEERLNDALEDRTKKIADAEEKLADTRIDAAKRVKEARKRLADFEEDSAKRIKALERGVVEARKARTVAISNAQIALERAQASGDAEAENEARRQLQASRQDRSVADAERSLAEEKKDRTEQQAELEADITQARLDGAQAVQEAEEDLAEAIKEANEAVLDAREALRKAHEEAKRSVDEARDAVHKLVEEADELGNKVERAAVQASIFRHEMEEAAKIKLFQEGGAFIVGPGGAPIFIDPDNNAEGGDVRAGDWSFVGEKGIELVQFPRNGRVTSNDDLVSMLRQLLQQGASSSGTTVHQSVVSHQADARVIANELRFLLMQGVTS